MMLSTLLENYLLRVGPWRALGVIFALGLTLMVVFLVGQPVSGVAPPSAVPLAPTTRQPTAVPSAVAGESVAKPAATPTASEGIQASAPAPQGVTTPTAASAQPAAPPVRTPDDPRPNAEELQEQAIGGRLGDTRKNIESHIGPPASHLSGQEFLYRAPTRFTITYSYSGRAMMFTIWAPRDPTRHPLAADPKDWTITEARNIASLFTPTDAQPLQTRKGFLGQPEDTYFSEALAQAVSRTDYVLAGAKGPSGTFGVMFTLNEAGFISMFTIGIR